jgi:hypothetical protein
MINWPRPDDREPMSAFVRRAQGQPARRTERERWLTRVWLDVQAEKRRVRAQLAEEKRRRDLPGKQAEQIARYRKMERDPFTQRILAEARQAEARRQAAEERRVTRIRENRAAEERAQEILRTEYGRGPAASPPSGGEGEAVRAVGYDRVDELVAKGYTRQTARLACAPAERDITRWAAQGVPLSPEECDYVHPHSGRCQARPR